MVAYELIIEGPRCQRPGARVRHGPGQVAVAVRPTMKRARRAASATDIRPPVSPNLAGRHADARRMAKTTFIPAFALSGVLASTACGANEPTTSGEHVALEAEPASAKADLDDANATAAQASADVEAATAEADAANAEAETARAEAETARAEAEDAQAEAETARAEAETLRLQYDLEIKAALTAAVGAEVTRACGQAVTDLDGAIADMVLY